MRFGLLYEARRPFESTSIDWNALYKETLEQCDVIPACRAEARAKPVPAAV